MRKIPGFVSTQMAGLLCLLIVSPWSASAGWLSKLSGDKEAGWRAEDGSWCHLAVKSARAGASSRNGLFSRIDAYIDLADLERMQGRSVAARAACDKALALSLESLKRVNGDLELRIPRLTRSYYALGSLHRAQRDYHQAEKAFDDAKRAGQLVLKPDDPIAARAAGALTSVMSTRGDLAQGRKLCIWAADHVIKHCGSNDVEVAWIDEMMGLKFAGVERYEDALLVYNHMLQVREAALPSAHPDLADAHNRIASLLFEIGRREEAVKHLEEALSIRTNAFGEQHPLVKLSRENLKNALLTSRANGS